MVPERPASAGLRVLWRGRAGDGGALMLPDGRSMRVLEREGDLR